ncbi:MAG: PAS domain S-box protein [Deltaproteobacteria bacterium]|nr:PAS domain S-box protein [Deltaproteobacteria bacterium]
MIKIKGMLNFLVIAIMLFMIALTAMFIYFSVQLKNKITFQFVQKTELVSELVTRSVSDIISTGHDERKNAMIAAYGNVLGIEDIGIYKPDGEEVFGAGAYRSNADGVERRAPGRIEKNEEESLKKAVTTMNNTGFFNWDSMTYSQYVPLRSEGACVSCHRQENALLGVLKIRLTTASDFELLRYLQRLVWTLWFIVFLPVGALLVAGAIIREKNRLFRQVEDSSKELQSTFEQLKGTKYYLQLILDNSRAIIITTNTMGRVVEFNKEAERLLEYKKEEVVGTDVLALYDVPQQRNEIIERGKPMEGDVWEVRNREVALKAKSGKLIHVIITLSTMVDEAGKIIGTVGVSKDISEQKMLQFKLMQSEKLAGIGTLASGIAHEINNPLAGILGMAEAIRDEEEMELIKSYANDIIQYSVNAGNIVRELSAYSRSAHNEANSTIDLSMVIENSLKMAKHSASFAAMEVNLDLKKECFIIANHGEIQQVFVNLMINAVHAMDGKGTLKLTCWKNGSFVTATVADNGHGIPPEHLSQIYDPFFTTKPVGMGTGLGLYVVYRIVMKHRGTIDVVSSPGDGARFTMRFPASDGAGS